MANECIECIGCGTTCGEMFTQTNDFCDTCFYAPVSQHADPRDSKIARLEQTVERLKALVHTVGIAAFMRPQPDPKEFRRRVDQEIAAALRGEGNK